MDVADNIESGLAWVRSCLRSTEGKVIDVIACNASHEYHFVWNDVKFKLLFCYSECTEFRDLGALFLLYDLACNSFHITAW